MSRILGEPRQVGYVVRDIEKAMKHWSERLAVGPWFIKDDIGVTEFTYYGRSVDVLPTVSIALANSGRTQIELIMPTNDCPSLWLDTLNDAGEGPQHIAYWTQDFDNLAAEMTRQGYVEGHAGVGASRGRFSYYVHDEVPGSVIELSEASELKADYFGRIAAAAETWDGSDPVRRQVPAPPQAAS